MTALRTPISNYITSVGNTISSDLLKAMGNLACSLTSTQVNSITSTVFEESVSILSKINLVCPNMASFYTKAKSSYSSTISSSALIELGSIISGITESDLNQITAETISSITTLAWKYMPASTVNLLSSTQMSGLTNTQVSSLMNSPSYSSFSSTIQSSVTSLSNGIALATDPIIPQGRNKSSKKTSLIYMYMMNIIIIHFICIIL